MSKKKWVAFDSETIADRSITLPEPEVALGNLKDPAKIEEKIKAAKDRQVEQQALDPWSNLICCFGWCPEGGEPDSILLQHETKEADFIAAIWDVLSTFDHFVTFNGNNFDIPILKIHSMKHRIRPAVNFDTKRYSTTGNHIDVRMVLGNWDQYAKGNLDFYLQQLLGRGKPDDISGVMVGDYWDCGMHKEIAEYCRGDAKDTMDLYQVVREYYL